MAETAIVSGHTLPVGFPLPTISKNSLSTLTCPLILDHGVLVDSNVLEERTNEVSLDGTEGSKCVNERTYRWPRLDLSLLRPLFVQIDVLWPRFRESVVCHFGTQVCCDACLCRSMSTGFGLVLSPASPLRVEDFGFVCDRGGHMRNSCLSCRI